LREKGAAHITVGASLIFVEFDSVRHVLNRGHEDENLLVALELCAPETIGHGNRMLSHCRLVVHCKHSEIVQGRDCWRVEKRIPLNGAGMLILQSVTLILGDANGSLTAGSSVADDKTTRSLESGCDLK